MNEIAKEIPCQLHLPNFSDIQTLSVHRISSKLSFSMQLPQHMTHIFHSHHTFSNVNSAFDSMAMRHTISHDKVNIQNESTLRIIRSFRLLDFRMETISMFWKCVIQNFIILFNSCSKFIIQKCINILISHWDGVCVHCSFCHFFSFLCFIPFDLYFVFTVYCIGSVSQLSSFFFPPCCGQAHSCHCCFRCPFSSLLFRL